MVIIISHFSFLIPHSLAQNVQSGNASFYAKRATGSRTANGERLHHDSLTCAHRSYPFGTMLKVTNVLNGKQVIVRVNDRGPYRRGRIIDLSWGAAKEIGMISSGIVPVTVQRLKEANIPFKPDDDDIELTQFEFELADIAPTGITPIWQQDLKIDSTKVKRSINRTVRKSAQEARQRQQANGQKASPTSSSTPSSNQKEEPLDILDEINQKPNGAKAYLKRQRK